MEHPNKQLASRSEELPEGRDQGLGLRFPIQLRKEENRISTWKSLFLEDFRTCYCKLEFYYIIKNVQVFEDKVEGDDVNDHSCDHNKNNSWIPIRV
jgi:hypothetical protein